MSTEYRKIVSQNGLDKVVSLFDVKTQTRLTDSFTHDDDHLNNIIPVCAELAQKYCNRLLTQGTVVCVFEDYKSCYLLWGGEIESITEVTALDASDAVVTITDYRFDDVTQKVHIPAQYRNHHSFKFTYDAGYGATPRSVKQGIILMAATMNVSREDFLVDQSLTEIPMTCTALLNGSRIYES